MLSPNLKAMIDMTISRLNAISELIEAGDKTIPPKAAKNARSAKAMIVEIIQQINDAVQAQKAPPAKKPK